MDIVFLVFSVIVGFVALVLWVIVNKSAKEISMSITFFGTVGLVFILIKSFLFIPYVYSDSYRSGELIKFGQKGLIFKTWEGTVMTGATRDSNWSFSVTDPNMIDYLKGLSEEQRKDVKLNYNQYLLVPLSMGATDYSVNYDDNVANKIK